MIDLPWLLFHVCLLLNLQIHPIQYLPSGVPPARCPDSNCSPRKAVGASTRVHPSQRLMHRVSVACRSPGNPCVKGEEQLLTWKLLKDRMKRQSACWPQPFSLLKHIYQVKNEIVVTRWKHFDVFVAYLIIFFTSHRFLKDRMAMVHESDRQFIHVEVVQRFPGRNRLEILLQREVRGPGHVSYSHCIWHLGLLVV